MTRRNERLSVKPIAYIRTDFPTKFGVPRQPGLIKGLTGRIVFEPEYRNPDALRGLEGYSHIWLIWGFSEAESDRFRPTVRPPRLGGNVRMGVFATRSPYRPNPLAISAVRIENIDLTSPGSPYITVSGADCADNTPIYDIKPYLAFADSIPEAKGGFTDETAAMPPLKVTVPESLVSRFPAEKLDALASLLADDPRPHYIDDSERIYGFAFAGFEIKFRVSDSEQILTVTDITPLPETE